MMSGANKSLDPIVLQKRIAELEAALEKIEYLDSPQVRGLPRRKTIQEIARAALEGGK